MTLREIIKHIKIGDIDRRSNEITRLIDDESCNFSDSAFDDSFRAMIESKLDVITNFFVQLEAKADIAAVEKTQKALTILLSELSKLLNSISLAWLFAALSLQALRKQKNINDKVVISMDCVHFYFLNLTRHTAHLLNLQKINLWMLYKFHKQTHTLKII